MSVERAHVRMMVHALIHLEATDVTVPMDTPVQIVIEVSLFLEIINYLHVFGQDIYTKMKIHENEVRNCRH